MGLFVIKHKLDSLFVPWRSFSVASIKGKRKLSSHAGDEQFLRETEKIVVHLAEKIEKNRSVFETELLALAL